MCLLCRWRMPGSYVSFVSASFVFHRWCFVLEVVPDLVLGEVRPKVRDYVQLPKILILIILWIACWLCVVKCTTLYKI
jgi:hypothetical protein